jgi:hypothetical protein
LIDLAGEVTALRSDAKPTKAPPPWQGEPYGALTGGDEFLDLAPWEGIVSHLYRDNAKEGNITCGVGCKLENLAQAQTVGFWNMSEGRPANPAEVARAWTLVSGMKPGLKAESYRLEPNIALPDPEIRKLFDQRVDAFFKDARSIYPDFDTYPRSARRGLLDMLFQLGATGLKTKFPTFNDAVKNRKWKVAAAEALTGGNEERSTWRRSLFEYAQRVEAEKLAKPPASQPGAQ